MYLAKACEQLLDKELRWSGLAWSQGQPVWHSQQLGVGGWLMEGGNVVVVAIGYAQECHTSVAEQNSKGADRKATDTGHFATEHFSKRLLPELAFTNISFGYRVSEPMFGTHSLLNTVYGTGPYKNKVAGDYQGFPESEKPQ